MTRLFCRYLSPLRTRCISFLFLILLISPLQGQTGKSTLDNLWVEKAETFLKRKQYDSAKFYFEKVIDFISSRHPEKDLGFQRAQLAKTLVSLGEYKKAKELSDSILNEEDSDIFGIILTYQNLGAIADLSDKDQPLALKLNHKALSLSKKVLSQSGQMTPEVFKAYRMALQGLAYQHRGNRSFDSAQFYFKKAIRLSENKVPFEGHLLVFDMLNLATLYLQQGKFQEARAYLADVKKVLDRIPLETQESFEVSSKYYNRLGGYYNRVGYEDSSIIIGLKEEEIFLNIPYVDSVALAMLLTNNGIAYYNIGDFVKAKEYEKRSLAIKKRILEPDHYLFAKSYTMLGTQLINDSRSLDEAIHYFEEALRITKKHWGNQSPRTVGAMQALGYAYDTSEKNEKALKILLETLELQLVAEGLYVPATAEMYSQIGSLLRDLGRYEESISYFKEYFEISAKIKQANMSETDLWATEGLGKVYLYQEDYAQARKLFESCRDMIISLAGENDPLLAQVYNNLARVDIELGSFKKAREHIKKAIEVNSYDKSTFSQKPTPLSWLAIRRIYFLESYLLQTEVIFEQLLEKKPQVSFEEAWKSFETTEQIIQELISAQNNPSDVMALQRYSNDLYSDAISYLWNYDGLPQKANQLWALSEKSKGTLQKLKERRRQESAMSDNSAKIHEEEDNINNQIDHYKSMILNGNTSDSIQSKLFHLIEDKRAFKARIENEFYKDFELIYANHNADLGEIVSQIGDKTVIDFFEAYGELFVFLISSEGVKVQKLDYGPVLSEKIGLFNASLKKETDTTYAKAAFNLYQALIAPLEKDIRGSELIIIPNKELWNVNFDLLLTERPSHLDFKTYPYLLKKYTISYAYSSSLLLKERQKRAVKTKVLAFAYSESQDDASKIDNLRDAPKANLPGTAEELRDLSKKV